MANVIPQQNKQLEELPIQEAKGKLFYTESDFSEGRELSMLVQVNSGWYTFIGLNSGNRWADPVHVPSDTPLNDAICLITKGNFTADLIPNGACFTITQE